MSVASKRISGKRKILAKGLKPVTQWQRETLRVELMATLNNHDFQLTLADFGRLIGSWSYRVEDLGCLRPFGAGSS